MDEDTIEACAAVQSMKHDATEPRARVETTLQQKVNPTRVPSLASSAIVLRHNIHECYCSRRPREMALSQRLLTLRQSPVLLKLPPYLSALCILVGVAWVLLLPLNEYSRRTYISENAILPGQVHTYFGGSEHNVFRAYRQEVWTLSEQDLPTRIAGLRKMFKEMGLKDAEQEFDFSVAGEKIAGTNAYAILQAPRADATEAMVLMASWVNFDNEINYSGVALALTMARYFARWSVWSKDIIVLISADSTYGPVAWLEAYHTASVLPTSSKNISALPIKSGALQAAVALDYPVGPWGQRFDKIEIAYDGINGALPNLDLLNTAVQIAQGSMGIGCFIHGDAHRGDDYLDRLRTIAAGVVSQGVGHSTGPHSAFMPYHIDAITLKTSGSDGWHDEMTLGRVTESVFRSINNLLEHLHQSFFFYILLGPERFVSIGNYLPAAMLVAGSFTITALALWVQSGRDSKALSPNADSFKKTDMVVVSSGKDKALVPVRALRPVERDLFLPLSSIVVVYAATVVPFFAMTHGKAAWLSTYLAGVGISQAIVAVVPYILKQRLNATSQHFQIIQAFTLLALGATLSTMATLNFSLALVLGLVASPLSFVRPLPKTWLRSGPKWRWLLVPVSTAAMIALSPPLLLFAASKFTKLGLAWMLLELARGSVAQGAITSMIIWCIWWPSWTLSAIVLYSGLYT